MLNVARLWLLKRDSIYVQVFADRFVVLNVDSGATVHAERDMKFASPRMLIADFTLAEYQLRAAVKKARRGILAPNILIHPMELVEGGITAVEYRMFVELGIMAGAHKAAVREGEPLNGDRVAKAIRDYRR